MSRPLPAHLPREALREAARTVGATRPALHVSTGPLSSCSVCHLPFLCPRVHICPQPHRSPTSGCWGLWGQQGRRGSRQRGRLCACSLGAIPLGLQAQTIPRTAPGMMCDMGGALVNEMCADGTVAKSRTITGTREKGSRGRGMEATKNQELPPDQQRPGIVPHS